MRDEILLCEDWGIWFDRGGLIWCYITELWPEWLDVPETEPADAPAVTRMLPFIRNHRGEERPERTFEPNSREQMTRQEWDRIQGETFEYFWTRNMEEGNAWNQEKIDLWLNRYAC